ncbi:MAG: hypothetical protein AAGG75_27945 [Bacteroidota bacterium]
MIGLHGGFGLLTFLPQSWLYMIGLILLECIGLSYLLDKRWFDLDAAISAALANIVSALVGAIVSMLLTGGFVLVIWFPWTLYDHILGEGMGMAMAIITILAFLLTLSLETWINYSRLGKVFSKKEILRSTLIINLISYFVGACLLLSYG